ncbi:MAG TPA: OadG family protein [Caproiciproducens sp.]|nr:OadG family protein [Caproiciproducens sp.]
MSFEQQVQLSLTVLLTGLAIVFIMLIALTFIIKGYGSAVSRLQDKLGGRPDSPTPAVTRSTVPAVQQGIPDEVVAAISAAVYMMYGPAAGKVKSIRRAAQPNRSAWRMAGLLENTRPF